MLENFPSSTILPEVDFKLDRGNTIIYHGHIGPERGITELIESISMVAKRVNDVSLSLFGTFRTEQYKKNILSLIHQLGLNDHVEWRGHISHREIWDQLAKNAIGVIPFLDNPLTRLGTPTKLFEFMAAGCRIVASDLKPMKRYDVDGLSLVKPGNVIALADHLVKELNNKSVKELQINQRKIINEYNWESISIRLIQVYKKLIP